MVREVKAARRYKMMYLISANKGDIKATKRYDPPPSYRVNLL